jgi:hypothetical protein
VSTATAGCCRPSSPRRNTNQPPRRLAGNDGWRKSWERNGAGSGARSSASLNPGPTLPGKRRACFIRAGRQPPPLLGGRFCSAALGPPVLGPAAALPAPRPTLSSAPARVPLWLRWPRNRRPSAHGHAATAQGIPSGRGIAPAVPLAGGGKSTNGPVRRVP